MNEYLQMMTIQPRFGYTLAIQDTQSSRYTPLLRKELNLALQENLGGRIQPSATEITTTEGNTVTLTGTTLSVYNALAKVHLKLERRDGAFQPIPEPDQKRLLAGIEKSAGVLLKPTLTLSV